MKTSLSPCCFLHLLAASRKFCSGFMPSIKRKTSRGRRPGWLIVILTLALTERRRSMTWCCSRWGRTEESNWQKQNVGCSCSLQSSEVHFCCVEAEIRTDSADCFNLNIFFSFFCSPSPSVSQSIKAPQRYRYRASGHWQATLTDSLQYCHHSERGRLSNYLLVCR